MNTKSVDVNGSDVNSLDAKSLDVSCLGVSSLEASSLDVDKWNVVDELLQRRPFFVSYIDPKGRLVQVHKNGLIEHICMRGSEVEVVEVLFDPDCPFDCGNGNE